MDFCCWQIPVYLVQQQFGVVRTADTHSFERVKQRVPRNLDFVHHAITVQNRLYVRELLFIQLCIQNHLRPAEHGIASENTDFAMLYAMKDIQHDFHSLDRKQQVQRFGAARIFGYDRQAVAVTACRGPSAVMHHDMNAVQRTRIETVAFRRRKQHFRANFAEVSGFREQIRRAWFGNRILCGVHQRKAVACFRVADGNR